MMAGNLHYCLYTKKLVDYQVSIENCLLNMHTPTSGNTTMSVVNNTIKYEIFYSECHVFKYITR